MEAMLTEDYMDPHQFSRTGDQDDDIFGDEDERPKSERNHLKINIPGKEDEDMDDLFGDDDAEEKKDRSPTPSVERESSEALSASELRHRRELEYEEDENQEEENVVELKHAMLSIPNIPMPKSSDGNNWVMKLPNFVKLDSKPYHPDSYVGPESVEGENTKEKSMSVKLEVENTIRWRWAKDGSGEDKRQSNSRIIRWSDGSMSLLLGKELFDISLAYEGHTSRPQTFTQGSQSQSQPEGSGNKSGGLTYLVAQHKRPGILQAEVSIAGQMTLRPTGMQSETHRKLARAVGQKHSRVSRLRIAPDSVIESEQQELQKAMQKKPRKPRSSGGESLRRKRSSFGRRRESVWSDEEPEAGMFDTDEEEGDYDSSPRKAHRDTETRRDRGDYQTDDFVVADSSEGDESDTGEKRGNKKKKREHSDDEVVADEMDALDELDAKIARNEEESRRKKKAAEDENEAAEPSQSTQQTETQDVDMEIESEEEDEEEDFSIRRTGSGSRKKRAIALEDDEEEE